ncbi:MAG TPA: hypothetical protein VGB59_05005 [Allosphingosinicella sp.]|jgi:hypothetical protein
MPSLWLALAALAAAPSLPTSPAGLWEGHIGTLPVRACFTERDWGRFGAYYYLSQLKLIPLEEVEGRPGGYAEGSAPGSRRWEIEQASAREIRGRWSDGKRSLAVRLTPLAGGDAEAPCASRAFHAPRLAGIDTRDESASTDWIAFVRKRLDVRGRFDVSVETIEFGGGGDAVRRINEALSRPLSDPEFGWFSCIQTSLTQSPHEGSFHAVLQPALISRRWLSITDQHDVFCGGAYPSSGQVYRLFDRMTGKEVDLRDWFNTRAVKREGAAGSADAIRTLTPEFRRFLLAGWRAEDPECTEVVRDEEFWNVGLTRKGLVFAPSLAHAVQACGIELTYSFERLRPFLTEEAASFLAAIDAERSSN